MAFGEEWTALNTDPRFAHYLLANAQLEKLAEGFRWIEGLVWMGDANCLLFQDLPRNRTMRWIEGAGVSVYRGPSGYANGQTRDRQGRLISCSHLKRCVFRTELDGSVVKLVDCHDGKNGKKIFPSFYASSDSNPISVALLDGRQKFTQIPISALAIFNVPHSPVFRRTMEDQAKAFEVQVPHARIVRVENADHYFFESKEADVVRAMNEFIASLPGTLSHTPCRAKCSVQRQRLLARR